MWTVVYIAPNKNRAEQLEEALISEGLLVNLRGVVNESENFSRAIEILVPESEVEEAQEIINSILTSR